ncbi:pyridoxal phosphate-dependent aminotransferase [Naumannella halotolerans]|uniref:pyridoxal phosphate-dependent aminotransferase n=1 Tax=Naumannella halotolerans TaxID=993414 RepID=UPI00370DC7FB
MRKPAARSAVPPFQVMEVLAAAAERMRTHGDAIMLCAGQPSTPAPEAARRAVVEAIEGQVLGYTEAQGILPLRKAIAEYHRRSDGIEVFPEEVVVTTGSSGGLTALVLAAFDPGAVIAMARPGYPAYRNTLSALGCEVLDLPCGPSTRFQPTVRMLQELPQVPDGLIIASPSNPTGTVIEPEELARISTWCRKHDCLLISDEIYHGVGFGRETVSARRFGPEAVVTGSVSKYFSMTGWRLGWLLLPQWLLRPVEVLSGNLSICPPVPSQHAAIGALSTAAIGELDAHVERYAANRELLIKRLPELGVTSYAPPDGAFYAWCEVSHLTDDSARWCAEMLAATGVAMTPGIDFDPVDGHRYVRLCFAGTAEELNEAIDRLVRQLH